VLRLLDYVREHAMMTRDHIPDRVTVVDERTGEQRPRTFDTSFASENWNRAIRDRGHPGMFVRRHLEACVLTCLAEELRTGDRSARTSAPSASGGRGAVSGSSSACPLVNHPASVRGTPSRGLPVNHRQTKAPGPRKALCIQSGMLPTVSRQADVRGAPRQASPLGGM